MKPPSSLITMAPCLLPMHTPYHLCMYVRDFLHYWQWTCTRILRMYNMHVHAHVHVIAFPTIIGYYVKRIVCSLHC